MLGVSEFPWIGRMEKVCPLQLISKPLGDPGTPLPGPLSDFPTTRPLGCTLGWFRGRLFWTTSQAVRGPAWGDSPGSRTRREGERERAWEGRWGGISAWPPCGQDPLPTWHPQQGPGAGHSEPGLAEGRRHVRGPCGKLSGPGSSSTDVLRVRPEL